MVLLKKFLLTFLITRVLSFLPSYLLAQWKNSLAFADLPWPIGKTVSFVSQAWYEPRTKPGPVQTCTTGAK